MPEPAERARYQFGPLERRGVLLGLSGAQLTLLCVAGLVGVLILRGLPGAIGGLSAAVLVGLGLAGSLGRIAGRPPVAWLPLLIAFGLRRLLRRHRFRSSAHLDGHQVTVNQAGELIDALAPEARPPSLRHLHILEVHASDHGPAAGVIHDPRRHTYVGVLRVRGRSFNLLDEAGQAAASQAWGAVLAGYALQGSVVSRLQWIERTLPEDGQALVRHFEVRAQEDAPEAALRACRTAIDEVGDRGLQHECLLAVQIDARRAWRQVRQMGNGDVARGACALLLRELATLATNLEPAGVTSQGQLGPRTIAEVFRTAHEPELRPRLRVIHGDGVADGPEVRNAWPRLAEESFAAHRTGPHAFHATYHVREWPRIEVGPGFLTPLLLHTQSLRTVAMTMAPIAADRASQEIRRQLAANVSDDQIRQKGGWLPSFRRTREHENVIRAEQELTDGHASYRFSAYVTVSARSREELEDCCAEIEQAASRSHLELDRLVAEQQRAFGFTLPLCGGLE
jgi:hypothetical protein